MQPAANTSASVPEKSIQPNKKTEVFLGKLGHLKSTAMAAVAALGLASSVEAEPIKINGLPNSSISGPATLSGGLASEAGGNTSSIYNSRLYQLQAKTDTSTSRFILTLDSSDVGVGGTLTITGTLKLSTQSSFSKGGMVEGINNTTYSLGQQAKWGKEGETMTTLAFIDGPTGPGAEEMQAWISDDKNFEINVPITSSGKYYLDNILTRSNISGAADFRGFTISYVQRISPPSDDKNTNAIPDTWEMQHFGALSPADGDPDHDGQTNILEYALDTNPMKANPSPITSTLEDGGDGKKYLTISFPRNPFATNLRYTVEGSNDLKLWEKVSEVVDTTQTKVTDIVSIGSTPTRFLRLKIDPK